MINISHINYTLRNVNMRPGRDSLAGRETNMAKYRPLSNHKKKGFQWGQYRGRPKSETSSKGFELQLQKMVQQAVMAALQGSAVGKRRDRPMRRRFF